MPRGDQDSSGCLGDGRVTLRTLPRAELCAQLSYLDDDGQPSERAIADLLRAPLRRWGLSPKRAVLAHARAQLRAAGIENVDGVPRIVQRLMHIGECEEVYVGHEPYLAPASPRWLTVGDGVVAYLGVAEPPDGLCPLNRGHRDIVRRLRIESAEDTATLDISGVQEVSLAEWLTPLGYLRHASRRLRKPARSDTLSLSNFWSLLEQELFESGLALGPDAEVRILGGRPGEYFGRHDSPELKGRWTTTPEDGVWCGYRRGYGDAHWHPCVIAFSGETRRSLDLYDLDEWRWALLARGRNIGATEHVKTEGVRVQLTFPLPVQLRAAMDILGAPKGPWQWEVSPGRPDVWSSSTIL